MQMAVICHDLFGVLHLPKLAIKSDIKFAGAAQVTCRFYVPS